MCKEDGVHGGAWRCMGQILQALLGILAQELTITHGDMIIVIGSS